MTKKRPQDDKWFRLRIFLWYVITEPIRQISHLLKQLFIEPLLIIKRWFVKQNKNMIWAYVASFFLGISLAINNKLSAAITFAIILLIILIMEYDKGYFMYRYRQHYKAKIKRQAKKQGLLFDEKESKVNKK